MYGWDGDSFPDILLIFPTVFSYIGSKSYLKWQNPYISISAPMFTFSYVVTMCNYPVTMLLASLEVSLLCSEWF